MPGVRLVKLLVNEPVPAPSLVCASAMVGFCEVLQQTPRAVTLSPPSLVTLPPHVAEVEVIAEIVSVVRLGKARVVKLNYAP